MTRGVMVRAGVCGHFSLHHIAWCTRLTLHSGPHAASRASSGPYAMWKNEAP